GTGVVTAFVSDPAGNEGSRSQMLTIDTTAPAVTITNGASALTNDATPELSGTANVAPGTIVAVTVADQTLSALVRDGGDWSVTAAALSDGPHRVLMAVSDGAGNPAGSAQALTVDTVSPVVAITGGDSARTSNNPPTITGTSNAAPGTTVTVSIAGQTMTTLLQSNRTWNVTPTPVAKGTWRVAASAPDPAGNVGRDAQSLTIATSSPWVVTGTTPVSARPHLTVSVPSSGLKIRRGTRLRVPFVLGGPAKVTLTVMRGTKVVAKVSTTRSKAGRGTIAWNGKIKGKLAPRGTYKVIVRAVSRAGTSIRYSARLRIV
ncbi:MAG TPA: Ig-like domain-containing protein, partial [Solirubrobacteraceae bacterium]